MRMRHPRVWVGLAVVIAVIPWLFVIRAIENAQPVMSPVRPSSVVWAGRVFSSPEQLGRWIRSRGGSYKVWHAAHPQAGANLGHTAPPATVTTGTATTPSGTKATGETAHSAGGGIGDALRTALRVLLEVLAVVIVGLLVALSLGPDTLIGRVRPEWGAVTLEMRVTAFAVAFSVGTGALVATLLG
jgi:hypothetical protein